MSKHTHWVLNNPNWSNKGNLKYHICSNSFTTRHKTQSVEEWCAQNSECSLLSWLYQYSANGQHASGCVGGWKQSLWLGAGMINHLACLQEVIGGLMLSICASQSSKEKLTGLFMWLNSCSACYTANEGVEGGSRAGEQLLGFRPNSRTRHVRIHIWQSRVSVKAHVFTGGFIRDM